jgi:L-ascorbate metabolism protein UlaG (beta-lactamase superfamily)
MRKALITLLATAALAATLPSSASPPPGKGTARMIAARQRFFGKANVHPDTGAVRKDRVLMSWFSVANYVVSINGTVVLLDAWVARGSHSGYVPTSPQELADAKPRYIFIGHGDFDHAADAAEIAALSGATIVGTVEHCESIQQQAGDAKIRCVHVGERGAPPGLVQKLNGLIPGVDISAVVHVHSSVESPEFADGNRLPCPPVWNALDTAEHPPTPEDVEHLFRHLPDARGGNVLYQFRLGRFSLAWHDTTGKIEEDAPAVVKSLHKLPPTDVQFGSVLAFGQVTNCLRSLGQYISALRPKVYAATHHDNFTALIGANARDLEPLVRDELDRLPDEIRPELIYTYDPDDYLDVEPFTFDPSSGRWR